jgi:protein TonB
MVVTVNYDGHLVSTEIAESSGNRLLDRRAEAIARNAAPFGRFTKAMRTQADQIVVVSRFKFTRDETLETRVNTP